jgi:hypothetical protein
VDVDGHLGVIAYDRTPNGNGISQICIWDIDIDAVLRFITAPEVRSLSLLCSEAKLLVGSLRMLARTRTHARPLARSHALLQIFDVTTGQTMVSFKTDNIGADSEYGCSASVWTDWKDKIVCGFANGMVGIYDLTRKPLRPEPIVCFKGKGFSEGNLPEKSWILPEKSWIKDVSFDGIYLVFNYGSDVCLFDFLKLRSRKF